MSDSDSDSDIGYLEPFQGETITIRDGGDWVLDKYLSGIAYPMRKKEAAEFGPCFGVAKFACHLKGDESKKGFFRMYRQIPIGATERKSPEERSRQAVEAPKKHTEPEALLALQTCDAVPKLLAYEMGEQSADDMVPRGYFIHFVWAKELGEPLNWDLFWTFDKGKRTEIRQKFRDAYQSMISFGWEPSNAGLEKLIYDEETKTLKISGFTSAAHVERVEPWEDDMYAAWDLVDLESARKRGWREHPEEWTW
ncbi:hypothetical protein PENDEC_c037G05482 [Penicillium decumbens]|uniref:Protein kinase domain-containing protein n=1 Tax=Penicillium decumbens TaxID=69771 RepID=A0A1V6NRN8_PENDC|nr:hypothetical protein PENDEC_c037G05482 [Penicillium decumbens]